MIRRSFPTDQRHRRTLQGAASPLPQVVLSLALLFGTPALGGNNATVRQEQTAEVPAWVNEHLSETSKALNIDVRSLYRARIALAQATNAFPEVQAEPFPLIGLWRRLNPIGERKARRELFNTMRGAAAGANSSQSYLAASDLALRLLASLPAYDVEKVCALVRNWPQPAFSVEAIDTGRLLVWAARGYLRGQAIRTPERALSELQDFKKRHPEVEIEFGWASVEALIAWQLSRQGSERDAARLIDQTFQTFMDAQLNDSLVEDFQRALAVLTHCSDDYFFEGFRLLEDRLKAVPASDRGRVF